MADDGDAAWPDEADELEQLRVEMLVGDAVRELEILRWVVGHVELSALEAVIGSEGAALLRA